MSWIEGITDLCTLSATCKLDWDAWDAIGGIAAAVGTFVAVLVALGIARRDSRAAERDRKDKARGLHLLLIEPLRRWRIQLQQLEIAIAGSNTEGMLDNFEGTDGNDVLRIPQAIDEHVMRVGELGDAGLPLSLAIHRARIAKDMEPTMIRSLRGDFNSAKAVAHLMEEFHMFVRGAVEALSDAIDAVERDLPVRSAA
jgi:hypothetical protein